MTAQLRWEDAAILRQKAGFAMGQVAWAGWATGRSRKEQFVGIRSVEASYRATAFNAQGCVGVHSFANTKAREAA